MNPSGNNRLITCILEVGKARELMKKLTGEKGLNTVTTYHARGEGQSGAYRSSFAEQLEKDVLEVLVSGERADEIFAYLYHEAEIYQPHKGFMYMRKVGQSSLCILPQDMPKHF